MGISQIQEKERILAGMFIEGVKNIPGVTLYGDIQSQMRTAIVTLNIGKIDSSQISDILWEDYQICVRGGAHCAPLMHEALHTAQQGAVRFSFSYFNTEEEIQRGIKTIRKIAEDMGDELS